MKKQIFYLITYTLLSYQYLYADAIILNEYNAVGDNNQLQNNGYDTHFGDINGNGGDWIELVVTEDYLDLRGAILDIKRYSTGVHMITASFPNITQLAYLRKGTIITISEESTDISYSPKNGDWTINLNINDLDNVDGVFDISASRMDISIKSENGSVLMQSSGEAVLGWGINDKEVFKLKKDPSSSIQPNDPAYGDDLGRQIISTFGSPNQWFDSNNIVIDQNFDNIRDINSSIDNIILLNEYNGVSSNKRLKGDGNDTYFGKIDGNGGSWIELVILKDKTDLRNAEIKIDSTENGTFRATFPNIDALSQLRGGTILTISDSVATDLSYDPFNQSLPDWNINIDKDDLNTIEGNFKTDSKDLVVSIISGSADITIMSQTGEGITNVDIDDEEVFKLKDNPSFNITPTQISYGDDNNQTSLSSFGTPNHWRENGLLIEQDFKNLRLSAMKNNFYKENSSLVLNEYNAVASNRYPKNGGSDGYFGTVEGNGGSWLELVVTRDYLDIRNAILTIKENATQTFSAKIPELLPLGYLRKGTIITISNEFTDISYAPFSPNGDDWKLNINIDDLIDPVGTFNLNDNNIDISIVDSNGTKVLLSTSGEGIWNSVVDNQEVYKLKAEPNKSVTPFDNSYGDDNNSTTMSTFSSPNKWVDANGTISKQEFDIRKNKNLVEIGGIVTANIDELDLRDGEELQYVAPNNSLWIADDSKHAVSEIDLTTKEVKTVFDDKDFGLFAPDIEDECHDSVGICDVETVVYNDINDTLYVFVGNSSSTSAIFKLTRESVNDKFAISDYRLLNGEEYPASIFINGNFIVSKGRDLYQYNFETNQIIGDPIYTTPKGGVVGLAYANNTLLITTSEFELLKVNWQTKELEARYDMNKNGVYDPRGVEVINNRLYILDGVNSGNYGAVTAPMHHPLKGAIHIYESYINGANPVITMNGDSVQTVDLNSGAYVDAGATATDAEDGDINVTVTGSVDTTKIGTYTIRYSVTDSDGNMDSKKRTVYVIDPSIVYKSVPNDYPTIRDAIANASDGDLIILEPGVYSENSEIVINQNNLTIASRYYLTHDESFISSTIIKGINDKNINMFQVNKNNKNANSIRFIGITAKEAGKFITFVHGDNHLVDHCIIKDIRRDAVSFDTSATGSVTYSTIENPGDDAIDVDTRKGTTGGGFEFAYNNIINAKDDGIEIHLWYYQNEEKINPTMHFNIHHNTIKNSDADGIQLIDFDKTQDNNGVPRNEAIDYPTATNRAFEIYNNTIEESGQVAIGAIFQSSQHEDVTRPASRHYSGANMGEAISIHNNIFRDNAYHILGGDNMNVHNNEFINASVVALKRVKGDSVIDNNTFNGNAQDFEDCNN